VVSNNSDFHPLRLEVGGIHFSVTSLEDAIAGILRICRNPQDHGTSVHFANAYNVAIASKDRRYRDLLNDSPFVFADGIPIVWAGKHFYPETESMWDRVYGPDVMSGVMAGSDERGPKHFLLGGAPETLDRLKQNIRRRWPSAQIAGSASPPYRTLSVAEVDALAASLPVTALAVGAAFDFLAETVEQAPAWMQRNGLEWSFRLAKEPRRLARRYFEGNSLFMDAMLRQKIRRCRQ